MDSISYSDEALRFRLDALQYPFLKSFDPSDKLQQQQLVCWLEDKYIRRYSIKNREPLRKHDFKNALNSYLRSLQAPSQAFVSESSAIRWLIDTALSFAYADDEQNERGLVHDPWYGRSIPTVSGMAKDSEIYQIVKAILQKLGEAREPSDTITGAKVAAAVVEHLVTADEKSTIQAMNLDNIALGFDTGDALVNRLAKIVRVLNVRELREVQDCVNHVITEMQKVTAKPSTDAKLGKVGR